METNISCKFRKNYLESNRSRFPAGLIHILEDPSSHVEVNEFRREFHHYRPEASLLPFFEDPKDLFGASLPQQQSEMAYIYIVRKRIIEGRYNLPLI